MKKQPLLFVELLFWKTRRECHYINAEYLLSELGHLKKESANWNNTQGDEEIGSSPAKVWTQDIKSKIKPSNFASKLLCMILYFLFLLGNFFEALRWPFLECGTNFQFMLVDWLVHNYSWSLQRIICNESTLIFVSFFCRDKLDDVIKGIAPTSGSNSDKDDHKYVYNLTSNFTWDFIVSDTWFTWT